MGIEEIKAYLEENKDSEEVKAFVETLNPITKDKLETFVRTDKEVKSWFDSEKDKHSAKSLETWKTNNLQKLIDEKVKELYPEEDPKDAELKKMKQEIEKMKQEKQRETLTNKALKIATEKKLPTELIDLMIGGDEEGTIKNLETLESVFGTHVEQLVTDRLKSGYQPPKDNDNDNNNPSGDFMNVILENQVKR